MELLTGLTTLQSERVWIHNTTQIYIAEISINYESKITILIEEYKQLKKLCELSLTTQYNNIWISIEKPIMNIS